MNKGHALDFTALEAVAAVDGLRVYPLPGAKTPFGEILLAVDEQGQRTVMVPLDDGCTVRPDRESAGIRVLRELWTWQGRRRPWLVIRCTLPHLDDLFALIARDMVAAILAPQGGAPDVRVRAVLNRWRQLLNAPRRDVPSIDVLQGLWGELWHVQALTDLGRDGLAVWTGPDRTSRDFTGAALNLEVKTIRSRSWKVRVSSIDQLDDTNAPIVLSVLRVERSGTGGASVPELVSGLVDSGLERAALATALQVAGLDWEHLAHAEVLRLRFELRDHLAWRIDDDFPRIVSTSFADARLPSGVTAVQYDIELSERVEQALTGPEFNSVLAELAPERT